MTFARSSKAMNQGLVELCIIIADKAIVIDKSVINITPNIAEGRTGNAMDIDGLTRSSEKSLANTTCGSALDGLVKFSRVSAHYTKLQRPLG